MNKSRYATKIKKNIIQDKNENTTMETDICTVLMIYGTAEPK